MKLSTLPLGVQNIVKTYEQAYSHEIQQGLDWYPNAYKIASRMSQKYSIDINQVVGVLAVISPNNLWERNCIDCENILRIWATFKDVDLKNADKLDLVIIKRCLKLVKICTFNSNKDKAIKVLMIKNKIKSIKKIRKIILGKVGFKVVEFMNSILGLDDCCIDGHAFSIHSGVRIPTTKTPAIGKKLRESIKDDYRLATKYINYDLGTKYKVSEIQAITWVTHKRIHS